jgi:hypothetical protein
MKAQDERFRIGRLVPWKAPGPMLRRGVHGGSAELLTREQRRAVDDECRAALLRLGSDLPYEEFADLA